MEVSPLLADDTAGTIEAAQRNPEGSRPRQSLRQDPWNRRRHPRHRGSHFPRRPDQRDAAVFARTLPCGGGCLPAGIERRLAAGLDPRISSVASLFISRWDRAVAGKVPANLQNR
jgi:transaldolase